MAAFPSALLLSFQVLSGILQAGDGYVGLGIGWAGSTDPWWSWRKRKSQALSCRPVGRAGLIYSHR